MKKADFIHGMIRVRKHFERKDQFVCHSLGKVFDNNELAFLKGSKVCELYKSIINGKDQKRSGMFGMPYSTSNQEHRKNSIELFELVMLDEQLYRGL